MSTLQRKGNWIEYQANKQVEGLSLETVLQAKLGLTPSIQHKMVKRGEVQVNGHKAALVQSIRSGDRVQVQFFEEEDYGIIPEPIPIDVLYEDDHILVVNKAPGIAVHPTDPDQSGTLAHAIAYHYQLQGAQIKVRHVHRLDKDTSGVLLIAKHAVAHTLLDEALRKRRIKRQYVAIATGVFKAKQGEIAEPIGRDRHHPTRRRVSPTGDPARTHYRIIEQFAEGALIQLQLETGRTHQIRVHLSHIGHPLYGDTMYGGPRHPIRRQALHGERLCFSHPITGEELEIIASIPEDMKSLLQFLQQTF